MHFEKKIAKSRDRFSLTNGNVDGDWGAFSRKLGKSF
jgi:hypothetical protein